ncbi:DUF2490 domain-containing protein [Arenibacter certesii]|uniref:DUF2490 domain-containing protein n=1 Tax=Arenibacter certesii TaxID=228955 RepID=A0A918IN47_9FLAO|nr:DUF2490 domain-containing protein [Arenibacter certesii]GGW21883.1 hypothetical protein GCM10007383_00780 [Arenibacter certesii]
MKNIFGLCLLLCIVNLNAQDSGDHKTGFWYQYVGHNRVSEKMSVLTEVQLRYFEQSKNFQELVLRTGANYSFAKEVNITLGYAYLFTDDTFEEFPDEENIREHRIFEQVTLKQQFWEMYLEHRYVLEQRFLDFGDQNETQHRARYRLQLTLPLTNTFFVNLSDEVMLNLQEDIFNQNRLYAGLGVRVTNNLNVEAGFLKTHFSHANYERLLLGVTYNPDLRGFFKKK